MSNYINNPRILNTTAKIADIPHELEHGVGSPISTEISYFNGLGEPVTIVDRSGLPIEIPPMYVSYLKHLVVRYRVTYSSSVKIDLTQLSNAKCVTSITLRDAINLNKVKQQRGGKEVTINYAVTAEELLEGGGSLYLTNLDLVISTMRGHYVPRHPLNYDGIRNSLVSSEETINRVGSFGYSIQIIDNEGVYGKRYININREVFEVVPIEDRTRLSGVYHARTGAVNEQGIPERPVATLYTFDEAETVLGFYKTREEAFILGDLSAERKRLLDEQASQLKHDEALLKRERLDRELEFEDMKRRYDQERLIDEEARRIREANWKVEESQVNERLIRMKAELAAVEHTRDLRSMHRKDLYEERSYDRKDSSEFLKWLPGLVTGVAAILFAFYK